MTGQQEPFILSDAAAVADLVLGELRRADVEGSQQPAEHRAHGVRLSRVCVWSVHSLQCTVSPLHLGFGLIRP